MKKKLLMCAVIAAGVVLGAVNIFGDSEEQGQKTQTKFAIDGVAYSTESVVKDDLTYVPVRSVFEQMDFFVDWDGETKTAIISNDDKEIRFCYYDEAVVINADRMYVPLRMATQALGADINWDAETRTVIINTGRNTGGEPKPVSDDSSFAFKLKELMPRDENYMFSPYSLKCAFAMAANGADEDTKAEITRVFDIEDLDSFNDSVSQYIAKNQPQKLEGFGFEEESTGVELNIANSVWLNSDYTRGGDFSNEFKQLISDKFGGTARSVNNSNAVETINNWCAEKTKDKIKEIISSSDFQACLTNAVYFKGGWVNEFPKSRTEPDTFTDRNGNEKQIDFMHQQDEFMYYEDDAVQLLKMPYLGSSISMYVALTGDKSADIEKYIDLMHLEEVNVTMPKFKTEYSVNAAGMLKNMGIQKAFAADAPHFAKMFNSAVNDSENICISDVLHKTYIDVDEEGTEAAAVTAIMMNATAAPSMPQKIYEFRADKPFTYMIRDDETGDILFMGEYAFAD